MVFRMRNSTYKFVFFGIANSCGLIYEREEGTLCGAAIKSCFGSLVGERYLNARKAVFADPSGLSTPLLLYKHTI